MDYLIDPMSLSASASCKKVCFIVCFANCNPYAIALYGVPTARENE